VEGAFDHSELNRAISREDALALLRETEEAGLVHSTGNYRDEHHYICNCCSCCCGVLRGVTEFGIHSAVDHSRFRAVSDADLCAGCEDCVERCPFGAISVPEDVSVVDLVRCVGCGQCVGVCPTEALQMVVRPQDEVPSLATDRHEWTARRAQARGLSMPEIQ